MRPYRGYLSPYVAEILEMAEAGVSPRDIAKYLDGVIKFTHNEKLHDTNLHNKNLASWPWYDVDYKLADRVMAIEGSVRYLLRRHKMSPLPAPKNTPFPEIW